MHIYHYHPTTGEYRGPSIAQMSPLEKDKPQTMAFSTLTEPLPQKDGYSQKHIEATDSWEYIIDLRGTEYWTTNGEKKTHEDLGDLPEGASLTEPEPSDEEKWRAYQVGAQAELSKSDGVAMRCWKAGVAYPTGWLERDDKLRTILRAPSGDPSQPLPERPDYPAGT